MTQLRAILWLALCVGAVLSWPALALDRTQLAVIVNTRDPLSVKIGKYYAEKRGISLQNVIKVSFTPIEAKLTRSRFELIKAQVDKQTMPQVQAYALTWAAPYRVECMSITAAFTFGFDPAFCADECKPTKPSRYFNSPSRLPFTQLGIRPTMAIAATSFEQAKALIDRGVKSDGSRPSGTAYLLSTSDGSRNMRSASYPLVEQMLNGRVRARRLAQDSLTDESDVLFYFIGKARVEGLQTLHFLPGAIADHVTSTGGVLTDDSGQMSALRWLEAGATGSYGTVVEPCNLVQKFPNPPVVIGHYLQGETLIEAYWKSVLMPGQGIFIGEPLAEPFRRPRKAP
ncbi:MAG TPA: TIGR03790 family protein [Burkholderiales bacterium]